MFFGFGYHGNGVNNSNWTGKQIADWMGSGDSGDRWAVNHLPAIVRGLSAQFPLPRLRLRYLQGALAWKQFRNWLS